MDLGWCTAFVEPRRRNLGAIVFSWSTVLVALSIAGCAEGNRFDLTANQQIITNTTQDNQTDLAIAQASFERGAYGLAEKHFRLAVEQDRNNAEAWLGLAASYDHLNRYDLADRSYAKARALLGDDPVVLNNQGYSRIMRGDLAKAEALLLRAQRKAPDDKRIAENISLLKSKQNRN